MDNANPYILALTGEYLAVNATLEELPFRLNEMGWTKQRLGELRAQRQLAGKIWPFEVPKDLLGSMGFAQFSAGLTVLRQVLHLDGLYQAKPSPTRNLTAAELQLLADRPPHWG